MSKSNFNSEFISMATTLYREGLPDPIEAAASHPLMAKATRMALFGYFDDGSWENEYQELLVTLGWEFCLGPDELCQAMRLSEKGLVSDQT